MSTHSGSCGALWGGHPAPRGGRDHASQPRQTGRAEHARDRRARRPVGEEIDGEDLIVLRLLCRLVVTSGRWRCIGCWRVPSGLLWCDHAADPEGLEGVLHALVVGCHARKLLAEAERAGDVDGVKCTNVYRLHLARRRTARSACVPASVMGPVQRASFGEHVA